MAHPRKEDVKDCVGEKYWNAVYQKMQMQT